MEHGDRGMGVSHLRYEDEEGECVCTYLWIYHTLAPWAYKNGKAILPILDFYVTMTDHTNF